MFLTGIRLFKLNKLKYHQTGLSMALRSIECLYSSEKNKKTVLITGASSGIGQSCSRKFAKEGYDLLLIARRCDRLEGLRKELLEASPSINIKIKSLDVRNRNAVMELSKEISDNNSLDVLVNNAGLVLGLDPLEETSIDDIKIMFDTNVLGCIYFMQSIVPIMKRNNKGHIINIGSIAGKQPYRNGSIYCATKSALLSITDSLRYELMDTNVKVSSINPGLVQTEFSKVRFKGNSEKANNVYNGMKPLTADDVADIVVFVATRAQHVVLSDIIVYPVGQADATSVHRKQHH